MVLEERHQQCPRGRRCEDRQAQENRSLDFLGGVRQRWCLQSERPKAYRESNRLEDHSPLLLGQVHEEVAERPALSNVRVARDDNTTLRSAIQPLVDDVGDLLSGGADEQLL